MKEADAYFATKAPGIWLGWTWQWKAYVPAQSGLTSSVFTAGPTKTSALNSASAGLWLSRMATLWGSPSLFS